MFKPIVHFKTSENYDGFEIRHLFEPSYFDTIEELDEAYQEILDWLVKNCAGQYEIMPLDNAAFSDMNEDPWIGYYLTIYNPEMAMAFKLRWI